MDRRKEREFLGVCSTAGSGMTVCITKEEAIAMIEQFVKQMEKEAKKNENQCKKTA